MKRQEPIVQENNKERRKIPVKVVKSLSLIIDENDLGINLKYKRDEGLGARYHDNPLAASE